jgi:ACS family tartrate transporter-like MFS transporter
MITWGIVSACTLFVTGPLSFYTVRFLLGMAEAGFFPGMILYLSYWFPARERARAVGFFMSAIAISYAIGAPVSGAIMSVFDGTAGLKDWQWLFLIEALPAVLAGVFVWRYLDDGPAEARWLQADEKHWLAQRLEGEEAARTSASATRSARRSRTAACSCSAFCTSAWWSTCTGCRSGSARSSTRSMA